MSQPTPYNRQASFSTIQQEAPTDPLPGDTLDAELNAVKQTLDEILNNLEVIQRDDTQLANDSVGLDQLDPEVVIGMGAPSAWATATAYVEFNSVFNGAFLYICNTDHTSGTFATDLAAGKWTEIADFTQVVDYWTATSTTSVTIGTGTKTFTVEEDRFFAVGDFVKATIDASKYMWGQVTAYSGTTLEVDVQDTSGTGAYATWTIRLSGARGAQGDQGDPGDPGPQGDPGPAGEVTSTGASTTGNLAMFSDTTGDVIEDAGILASDVVVAADIANMVEDADIANMVEDADIANMLETTDIGVTVQGYDADTLKSDTTATITKGYSLTPFSAGTKSSGTYTPDPADGNYQYATNGGAHTLAAPSSDCAIDILYTNNGSAGAVTFSGFTVGSDVGASLTTTNTEKFIISIRRINAVATYSIYALQ